MYNYYFWQSLNLNWVRADYKEKKCLSKYQEYAWLYTYQTFITCFHNLLISE